MRITLFTSNLIRHNYLIYLLGEVSDQLFVVQEDRLILKENEDILYSKSETMKKYFLNVKKAELIYFKNKNFKKDNIKFFSLKFGEINNFSINDFKTFLQSDIYIVFGSSFIKNNLLDFLMKKNAINIHMGVSPFYKGTDCNFWALYDDNPHLVGSTIHLLSESLDSGPILYHAMSNIKKNPFNYTMSTVMSAFVSIVNKIKDNSIFDIKPIRQINKLTIRYSKRKDFNDKIVNIFLNKKINLNKKKINKEILKDPFILEKGSN